jgi:hypothetical protein
VLHVRDPSLAIIIRLRLRESYRDGKHVRIRSFANLSDWPEDKVETLRALLRGDTS